MSRTQVQWWTLVIGWHCRHVMEASEVVDTAVGVEWSACALTQAASPSVSSWGATAGTTVISALLIIVLVTIVFYTARRTAR